MKHFHHALLTRHPHRLRAAGIAAFAMVQLSASAALAQLPTQLPGGFGGGQSGNLLGQLGGSGLPSVTQAGPANTAGVLQYCVQNNYLSDGAAGSAKSALLSKLPGSGQNSPGFQQGSQGLLQTGQSSTFSLGGSSGGGTDGIKAQVTHKVCDMVLQHAKSLL